MNSVVLTGTLSRPPEIRVLPSGACVASLELTTRNGDDPAFTVPVAVHDPSPSVQAFHAGAELVVTGQVRRRFFRSGGVTQSRTEVVAHKVVPAHHHRRVSAAVERALEGIARECESKMVNRG
jgi:single-strand DNA-binding protein